MYTSIAAYQFVEVDDPEKLANRLGAAARDRQLLGTILIAGEGINLFLAGSEPAIEGFLAELRGDPRFSAIVVKRSRSAVAPFARLKVKVKAEIIAFRREQASPLASRAPAVAPRDLARWIAQGSDDGGRPLVLLDTRNREEVAYGTFAGAVTLPIDNFVELPDAVLPLAPHWGGATVVSFCTGGIRCEKAAPWLRAAGMDNVLQLDGGILGYFEAVGGAGYEGRCFVFDERVALDADLQPLREDGVPAERAAA